MRNLCTGDGSQILQALWLEKLPAQVTSVPAPVKQKSLDKQANHADTHHILSIDTQYHPWSSAEDCVGAPCGVHAKHKHLHPVSEFLCAWAFSMNTPTANTSLLSKCTEVRFGSFLSGGLITAIVVNPPEKKLAKRTSVQCAVAVWSVASRRSKISMSMSSRKTFATNL